MHLLYYTNFIFILKCCFKIQTSHVELTTTKFSILNSPSNDITLNFKNDPLSVCHPSSTIYLNMLLYETIDEKVVNPGTDIPFISSFEIT